jgi:hypothetical protein
MSTVVFVGTVETLADFKIRRVKVAVGSKTNVTKLNAVLRAFAERAGGAMWDRNFGAPRKDHGGRRVNFLHLPLTGALPDLRAALSAAGFSVAAL